MRLSLKMGHRASWYARAKLRGLWHQLVAPFAAGGFLVSAALFLLGFGILALHVLVHDAGVTVLGAASGRGVLVGWSLVAWPSAQSSYLPGF